MKIYAKVDGKLQAWNYDTKDHYMAIQVVKEQVLNITSSVLVLIKRQEGIGGA